jgi:hypothetical protein
MKPTASGLPRAEACPLSCVLPHVEDVTPRLSRDAGSAIHGFVRDAPVLGREAAMAAVPEAHREVCAALDLESILGANPEAWAQELALAWHPETGEAVELHRGRGDRDYSAAPADALVGTPDLVGLADGGARSVVLDLKTGWADLGKPEASLQLGFGAVAMMALHGCMSATVGFVRVINGEGVWRTAELDALDLAAMAVRLQRVWITVAKAELMPEEFSPVIGTHCRYCPAYLRCPAQMGLARELARDMELHNVELPPLTPEDFPRVLDRLEAGEALLKRIREHVEAYASAHPVHLPDGRVYGLVEQARESFDVEKSAPVLEALGLGAAVEVERKVTKASVKRAIQRALPPLPRGSIKKTFEALRGAGAAGEKRFTSVGYFRPGEPKALEEGGE